MGKREFFDRAAAAGELGIAPVTLWRWENEPDKYPEFPGGGLIKRTAHFHPTRRRYRYSREDIERIKAWRDATE